MQITDEERILPLVLGPGAVLWVMVASSQEIIFNSIKKKSWEPFSLDTPEHPKAITGAKDTHTDFKADHSQTPGEKVCVAHFYCNTLKKI